MRQNIRLIADVFEQTKLKKIPGILLLLDFKKAFDSIEWSFIQKTLDLFNFGNNIKQWITTFYTNKESAALHNGNIRLTTLNFLEELDRAVLCLPISLYLEQKF